MVFSARKRWPLVVFWVSTLYGFTLGLHFESPNGLLSTTIKEGQTKTIQMILCPSETMIPDTTVIRASLDPAGAELCSLTEGATQFLDLFMDSSMNMPFNCTNGLMHTNFSMTCLRMGRASVVLESCHGSDSHSHCEPSLVYEVAVLRHRNIIDDIGYYAIAAVLVLNNFLFGCAFDLQVAKEVFRRPVAPAIGLICQLLFLCPIIYGIAYVLDLPSALAFGYVAHGASPGGGASNSWTALLGGVLTLSLCMTVCSTLLSLGTVPLWLLTLGKTLLPSSIFIPVGQLMQSLAFLVVPLIIGLLIRRFLEKVGIFLAKAVRPAAVLYVLVLLTLGVYVYRYAFVFIFTSWKLIVAGLLQPLVALLVTGVIAKICRLEWPAILTVAIEVGIQNGAVTLIVLQKTLGQPEADIASASPIACILFTSALMLALLFCKFLYAIYQKVIKGDESEDNSKGKGKVNRAGLGGIDKTTMESDNEAFSRSSSNSIEQPDGEDEDRV